MDPEQTTGPLGHLSAIIMHVYKDNCPRYGSLYLITVLRTILPTSNTMAWEISVHNLLVLCSCTFTCMRIQNSNLVTKKVGCGSQPCVTFKLNMAISCFQDRLFHVGESNYLAASDN